MENYYLDHDMGSILMPAI